MTKRIFNDILIMYEYENAVMRSSRARIISESGRLVRVRIRSHRSRRGAVGVKRSSSERFIPEIGYKRARYGANTGGTARKRPVPGMFVLFYLVINF